MEDVLMALARILGVALATSVGCMIVAWLIVTFVATTAAVEVPGPAMAALMGIPGFIGAIAGGIAWALEGEGVK